MKNVFFFGILLFAFTCHAVTLDDVQKLDANKFFTEWSQFLDQVLKSQQEPMSDDDKAIYQEFIDQAHTLHIAQITGNENFLSDMQKQLDAIKKRVSNE